MIFAPLSPSDLSAVCLMRRSWRFVAEPLLYAHIEWTWTESQNPPIAQFLRSIVHRPELASLVHAVILNGDCFERSRLAYKQKSPKLPVTEDVLDELVRCIEKIDIPYGEQWIQELRAGTMDAFSALLLSRLPNLRSLYLGKNFARESRFMGLMLRSALCDKSQDNDLHSFASLRDVSAMYPYPGLFIRGYTDARNTADALTLFYLPSVERIRVLVDNPATFMWPRKYPPNPLRLASLDLTMLRERHLGQVLSVTRGLRKLRWDWYFRPDLEDHFVTDIIDLDQIAAGLSHVQDTLTDLTITARSDGVDGDIEFPDITVSWSFKAFSGLHMLEKLEVPIPFLLGFSPLLPNVVGLEESLPKSIQWLTLTDDLCLQCDSGWQFETEYLLGAFRSWLQDWKKFTPRLQGLRLSTKMFKERERYPPFIRGLIAMGRQVEIQVEISERSEVFF
ncbi:hypothetical protein ANOM_008094 [Aspergillus nomiae NRRL 13137]|uniref:F-box domain-containing protein n=1 Tax=Aspergillus nomiae NRRL (strain ATCC 15546 / NRRL 13137 / CBS 260.88 / M93) TaxID=1509407 RepID=A0A0L1J0C5_ASPN3|nr:uncharacterized protein ANOM_008094 [Aspergillus nomiae NRRL 13137]KNG85197.1 hypothetical protein ANOM_008094 [Aspergillus nomiae NRRL 13137]